MRKRHAARPMLEAVEPRMFPSALGILDPTAGIRAAISAIENHPSHAKPAVATHHAAAKSTRAAARAARHHQAAAATHHTATHHTTTHHSSSSSSSSLTSSLSNFFKSLGL